MIVDLFPHILFFEAEHCLLNVLLTPQKASLIYETCKYFKNFILLNSLNVDKAISNDKRHLGFAYIHHVQLPPPTTS